MSLLPLVPATSSTVRLTYSGGAALGFSSVAEECSGDLPRSLGVVCLAIPNGAKAIDFIIKDKSTLDVGGSYYIFDAAGELDSMGAHCGGAAVAVPAGGLAIIRMELINGPLVCASEGNTGAGEATKGIVMITIS